MAYHHQSQDLVYRQNWGPSKIVVVVDVAVVIVVTSFFKFTSSQISIISPLIHKIQCHHIL